MKIAQSRVRWRCSASDSVFFRRRRADEIVSFPAKIPLFLTSDGPTVSRCLAEMGAAASLLRGGKGGGPTEPFPMVQGLWTQRS
jgi:hypothetical protein